MTEHRELLDRVHTAYARQGFPAEIIGQWSIPINDALDLIAAVREHQPRRVLEVGTFVGVSTMLIALACPDAQIISIDPNFPLEREMGSMGSNLGHIDASTRTQELAVRVARELGVADRIVLVAGGFSSSATFSSRRTTPDLEIPIVGPEICKQFGPFDLAFIDGLHYADVVESDVTLATTAMTLGGLILLHDCVGMWGTNVRAGLSRFLSERREWRLVHPPLGGLYRSIGTLFRPDVNRDLKSLLLREVGVPADVESQLEALTASLVQHLQPASVIELTAGAPIFAPKLDGMVSIETIRLGTERVGGLLADLDRFTGKPNQVHLIVSAGLPDLLTDSEVSQLFHYIASSSSIAVFLRTPPGEVGSACLYSRTLRHWTRLCAAVRASICRVSPLDLDPSKFLFTLATNRTPVCTSLCNVVAIAGETVPAFNHLVAQGFLLPLSEQDAEVLEQELLLSIHYAGGFRWAFQQLAETQRSLSTSQQEHASLQQSHGSLSQEHASLLRQFADLRRQSEAYRTLIEWYESHLRRSPRSHLSIRATVRFARALLSQGLDSDIGVLIDEALIHATRHGYQSLCLMFNSTPDIKAIDDQPEDSRIKDRFDTLLQRRNALTGRYFSHGEWILPQSCKIVYFLGPWRLLTRQMLAQAVDCGVERLWVRVGTTWAVIAPQSLYRFAAPLRTIRHIRVRIREAVARTVRRSPPARHLLGDKVLTLDAAFAKLMSASQPRTDYVPGRIVIVSGNLSPGGAERQVANTAVGLASAGIRDVTLLAHHLAPGHARYDFHLSRVLAAGVAAREIERAVGQVSDSDLPTVLQQVARGLPNNLTIDVANLVREFNRLRPEIVHAWLDWDSVRAGLAAAIAGVPRILISGRNINPSHFSLYQPYMDPAYRALASLPHVIFLNNSQAGANDYADWIGIPRERITVIHNGVDFGGQQRLPADAILASRAELGIAENAFVVGGMFRFHEEKRPLLWLDVAAEVAKAIPDARFVLYGQGPLRAAMEEKIKDLFLGQRIQILDVTSDPLSAMSLMNVFLLTSYGEGLPNVLLEAQHVGTPVVCTEAGGAPEAVDVGVSGWVVTTHAPADIAAAIIDLHRDRTLMARAVERGPAFVRERFGVERMIAQTLKVYGVQVRPAHAMRGASREAALP